MQFVNFPLKISDQRLDSISAFQSNDFLFIENDIEYKKFTVFLFVSLYRKKEKKNIFLKSYNECDK